MKNVLNLQDFIIALKSIVPRIGATYSDNSKTRLLEGKPLVVELACGTNTVSLTIRSARDMSGIHYELIGRFWDDHKFMTTTLSRSEVFRIAKRLYPSFENDIEHDTGNDTYHWVYKDLNETSSLLVTFISPRVYGVTLHSPDMLRFMRLEPVPTDRQIEAVLAHKSCGLEWSEHIQNMFRRDLTIEIPDGIIIAHSTY